MKKNYIAILLLAFLLVGCEASDDFKNKRVEEIQIEMVKKFDVPLSSVNVEVEEMDGLTYTNDKFIIDIDGEDMTYIYIGNDFDEYELLIYEYKSKK